MFAIVFLPGFCYNCEHMDRDFVVNGCAAQAGGGHNMYEDTRGFKTAVVGGFNREDVLQYIEQSARESNEKINALQAEADQMREDVEELRDNNAALSQKNAELLERLGQMTVEEDQVQQDAKQAKMQAEQARAQAERDMAVAQSLQQSLQAADEEKLRLQEQIDQLQAQACEYQESKERLAEIELCAYRRAKIVEEKAEQNAQNIRMQSAELINQMKALLTGATEKYRAAHQHFVSEAADAKRCTETALGNIDVVLESLDEVMVGELSRGQENASERPSLAEVSDLLKGKEE